MDADAELQEYRVIHPTAKDDPTPSSDDAKLWGFIDRSGKFIKGSAKYGTHTGMAKAMGQEDYPTLLKQGWIRWAIAFNSDVAFEFSAKKQPRWYTYLFDFLMKAESAGTIKNGHSDIYIEEWDAHGIYVFDGPTDALRNMEKILGMHEAEDCDCDHDLHTDTEPLADDIVPDEYTDDRLFTE